MESSKIKMRLLILFCIGFILNTNFIQAQGEYDEYSFEGIKNKKKLDLENEYSKAVFKLSFLFPSVGGEVRLAERFSLDGSVRLRINAGLVASTGTAPQFWFFPQPEFHIEPKWNYNIRRRAKQGRKISKFSSNFLSLHSSFNLKVSPATANYLVIGPTWGVQRNMGKIGYFKFNSGLGYRHVFGIPFGSYIPVTPILNVQLGIMF